MASESTGGPIEVFFSYSHKDEDLRDKLATHLILMERQGTITSWHDRKILAGDEWEPGIDEHLNTAHVILLLVSVDFLASRYCYEIEMNRAMERHEAGEACVIPVILRPSDWKGAPFGKLQALPTDARPVTRWRSHDDALLDVTQGIRRALEQLTLVSGPAEGAATRASTALPDRVWHVPHERNLDFTGREGLLEAVQTSLNSRRQAAVTQAILGPGGVGKTELAIEYAYRHAASYDLVWWVRSEEAAKLAADYADLARALDLPEKDAEQQAVTISAVRRWLEEHEGWLLIFDNVPETEDVRDYLPRQPTGHVIVTSRRPDWGGAANALDVAVMERSESVEFLLKRTGQDDSDAANRLAEDVDDLPLALEQAAAYMKDRGVSLAAYVELFTVRQREVSGPAKPSALHEAAVRTSLELALETLEVDSPAAADLLNFCAFLAPDDIPLDIIRDGAEHLPERLAEAARDDLAWDDTIAALRRYSLVEVSGDAFSVHRLVQAVTRDRLSDEDRLAWAGAAVALLNGAFPSDVQNDVATWPVCSRLLPHVLAAAAHAEELKAPPKAALRLLNQVGLYLRVRGQLTDARRVLERALRIAESYYGGDRPEVAIHVSNLGSLLGDLGDLPGARRHLERALRIAEAAYGQDDSEVATHVNNLGCVLQEGGDLAGAEAAFARALRIDEAVYGPDHPAVARDVNNLGSVLRGLGDPAVARAHYERALRIDEMAYGPDHPNVAIRVNNLGAVLRDLGDLAGARAHMERALEIFRRFLGDDHPDTLKVQSNLESLG